MMRWLLVGGLACGLLSAQADPAAEAALARAYQQGTEAAFLAVVEQFPQTTAGAEAGWRVGGFRLATGRFEAAAAIYEQVAGHAGAAEPVACEALLQAALCPLYRAVADGATGAAGRALLLASRARLTAAVALLDDRPAALPQTAAAFAEAGLADLALRLGEAEVAGAAAERGLARPGVTAAVRGLLWSRLGRACSRTRRFQRAAECLAAAAAAPPGALAEQLRVGADQAVLAAIEQAEAVEALGELEPALALAQRARRRAEVLDDAAVLAAALDVEARLTRRIGG